jgi:hypothetical protein
MKLSTGSFWSAWKYCRVAEAIWTYRWSTGPASGPSTSRMA